MAADLELIFVHMNARFPVNYAAEHAAKLGYQVVVIGEREWNFPGCRNLDLNDYDDGLDEFRRQYIHVSSNKPIYERFCFERWFLLRNYHRKNPTKKLIYVDSDALVFPGVEQLSMICSDKFFDSPFLNYFSLPDQLELICSEILNTYSGKHILESECQMGKDGQPFFSDMLLFPLLHRKYPEKVHKWMTSMEEFGFDSNMNQSSGYQCFELAGRTVKQVHLINDFPVAERPSGERVRLKFLHFQGASKVLMRLYLKDGEENYADRWWPDSDLEVMNHVLDLLGRN